MKPGARVDSDNYAKDDARDFVLWKATKPGEPTWDVGRSAGPPGLAPRVLGDGAAAARRVADRHPRRRHRSDLPASRERDRAERRRDRQAVLALLGARRVSDRRRTRRCRSRSATSTRFPTSSTKGFRPSAVRYLLLSAHYRKQLNFTWASLAQAEEALRRLDRFPRRGSTRVDARRVASRGRARASTTGARGVRRGDARRPEHRRRRSARSSSWCAR